MIEQLSIDLTNHCDKGCPFCYNQSSHTGETQWAIDELIAFATDCVKNGVKAISFGGGEPLSYEHIFKASEALGAKAFVSITTNGLLLESPYVFQQVTNSGIDKIHITIHFPEDKAEVTRVIRQIRQLKSSGAILCGVNLLVADSNCLHAKNAYRQLREILMPKDIILIPMRHQSTPTVRQLSEITDGTPFQSPSCLLKCHYSRSFCSVSYDKKANWCSFAEGKESLESLDYNGLIKALNKVCFRSCEKTLSGLNLIIQGLKRN